MEALRKSKFLTLVNRELQEYRGSLVVTPAAMGAIFIVLMLLSILLAGRFVDISGDMIEFFGGQGSDRSVSIDMSVNDKDAGADFPLAIVNVDAGQQAPAQSLTVSPAPDNLTEDDWNFSKEWTFSAPRPSGRAGADGAGGDPGGLSGVFGALHGLFLLALFAVSVNYLLGCLYDDRKDRSILFWKSMPVAEREEIVAKLATAVVAAPLIFLLLSWVTQVLVMLLGSVLMWRMDISNPEMWAELQLLPIFLHQFEGMLVMMLFLVPLYAWFMLASAGARRSPFLMAVAIPVGLMLAEQFLFGTQHLMSVISRHFPRASDAGDAESLGFYERGPVWASLDYLGMLLGLLVGAVFLGAAGWLRRHRFEI